MRAELTSSCTGVQNFDTDKYRRRHTVLSRRLTVLAVGSAERSGEIRHTLMAWLPVECVGILNLARQNKVVNGGEDGSRPDSMVVTPEPSTEGPEASNSMVG